MITYGNGEVLFDGDAQRFELIYKGVIKITESPDSLFIGANKNKIVGVMLDGTNIPKKLFEYKGELKLLKAKVVKNNDLQKAKLKIQGVDYWNLDDEKWEDDGSLWGTRNNTYLVDSEQRFNKRTIVVNNNIKTQSDGQYKYSDDSLVPAKELIHIYADGTAMSGGTHTKDSVQIYAQKTNERKLNRIVKQSRKAALSGGEGGY